MATQIGPFQVGLHLLDLTLYGGVINSNGLFVLGTSYNLRGVALGTGLRRQDTLRNVKPISVFGENWIITDQGFYGQIRALRSSIAADVLTTIVANHTHCYVRRQTGKDRNTTYFLIANPDFNHEGIDEQVSMFDLYPIQFTDTPQNTYEVVA